MTAEQVLKGLEFAHPKGSAPQLLDLYLPTGAAGFRGRTCVVTFMAAAGGLAALLPWAPRGTRWA